MNIKQSLGLGVLGFIAGAYLHQDYETSRDFDTDELALLVSNAGGEVEFGPTIGSVFCGGFDYARITFLDSNSNGIRNSGDILIVDFKKNGMAVRTKAQYVNYGLNENWQLMNYEGYFAASDISKMHDKLPFSGRYELNDTLCIINRKLHEKK